MVLSYFTVQYTLSLRKCLHDRDNEYILLWIIGGLTLEGVSYFRSLKQKGSYINGVTVETEYLHFYWYLRNLFITLKYNLSIFVAFSFHKTTTNFNDSRDVCIQGGGDLATSNSPEKNALIIAESDKACSRKERCQWQLGYIIINGVWKWVDGSEVTNYTDWFSGYPMSWQNCVILNWKKKWQSSGCGKYNIAKYICEYRGKSFDILSAYKLTFYSYICV